MSYIYGSMYLASLERHAKELEAELVKARENRDEFCEALGKANDELNLAAEHYNEMAERAETAEAVLTEAHELLGEFERRIEAALILIPIPEIDTPDWVEDLRRKLQGVKISTPRLSIEIRKYVGGELQTTEKYIQPTDEGYCDGSKEISQ